MPAVKAIKPNDIFTREQWTQLTQVSAWKGLALIIHAWAVVFVAIAAAIWSGHWAIWIAAIIIIGGRQLGLAILMHDGAHGALHPKRKINNFLGNWMTGAFVGTDLHAYRSYHLTHHRFTQQAEDPDLILSAPFPVTRTSMMRKIMRDLSGLTFFKQRGGLLLLLLQSWWKKISNSENDHSSENIFSQKAVLSFLSAQAILLMLSFLSGYGVVPYLLWLIALATTFPLFLRIRNIAEHACAPVGSDDPFSHARTTKANILARATVAPYYVNYHCEHHLFMGVPSYNLPMTHALLGDAGYHPRIKMADNYMSVLREVTST